MQTVKLRTNLENEIHEILNKMSAARFPDPITAHERIPDENDQASAIVNRDLEILLEERERIRLRLLKDALSRIEGGSFGICASCNEMIPEKRLELNPIATHCVKCQDRAERNTGRIRKLAS
jgi:DnaK suppressor protein